MNYFFLRFLSFIFLGLPNIVGHTVGCYVLYSAYRNREQKILLFYILSLSFTEILWNVMLSLHLLLDYVGYQEAMKFVGVLSAGVSGMVYMCYLYIALNRLLEIVLNIRYSIYWNEQKAKSLVFVTGTSCFLFSTLMAVMSLRPSFGYVRTIRIFYMYIEPPAKALFLLIVIPIYIFLFQKFRKCRTALPSLTDVPHPSLWSTFCHSKFYTAVLLTFSYALFMVVPTFVIRHHVLSSKYTSSGRKKLSLRLLFDIVVRLSCLLDVWIYLSTEKYVKQRFWKVLRRYAWCRNQKIHCIADTRTPTVRYNGGSYVG